MDISRDETEPDTSVDINFEAKPNSYIGVAGIDQSVLLLKTGNDISHVSQPSMSTAHCKLLEFILICILFNLNFSCLSPGQCIG